ncbi:MAG TPA: FAD-binding oxidoreductase [Ktedonobacterales bacterium]
MRTSVETLQSELAMLVGGHARAAVEGDAVAGVAPRVVVEPETEEQVAAVLAFADRRGLTVLPRGGGTQLGMGTPPRSGDIALSLARLNGIVEHAPHDQTVSVGAGLTLAELQATLGHTHQWLALDPAVEQGATIGGLIATNASGARRLRYGGVRDQIIGIRVALADGTLAKGGGKVVKNVAGYDLPKLFTGALGTLGVIVSATFRLYPLPTASRTVLIGASSPDVLGEIAVKVIASTLVPTSIDLIQDGDGGGYVLAVRFESGVAEAVVEQCEALLALAGEPRTGARMLDGEEEAQFWREVEGRLAPAGGARNGAQAEASLLLKASVLPSDVTGWLGGLEDAARRREVAVRWRAHAGHGIVYARLSGRSATLGEMIGELRAMAMARRGSLVVRDAPPEIARAVDVWGPIGALDVMRRLKERFDPHATLNPGRFVGGI